MPGGVGGEGGVDGACGSASARAAGTRAALAKPNADLLRNWRRGVLMAGIVPDRETGCDIRRRSTCHEGPVIKPHAFLPTSHFEMLRGGYHDLVAKTIERLRNGTGIPQLCYETLVAMSLSNGCIALILDQGDDEARKHFTAASGYALKLLVAPGARGGGLRSYGGNVEVSEDSVRLTSLHEKVPTPGFEKPSISDFHRALVCVVAFGDRTGMAQVAAVPEDQYRNPGTIASEDQWAHLRAWRAMLRGDEAEARREAEAAVAKSKPVEPSRLALGPFRDVTLHKISYRNYRLDLEARAAARPAFGAGFSLPFPLAALNATAARRSFLRPPAFTLSHP